jgi:hypothetical protein
MVNIRHRMIQKDWHQEIEKSKSITVSKRWMISLQVFGDVRRAPARDAWCKQSAQLHHCANGKSFLLNSVTCSLFMLRVSFVNDCILWVSQCVQTVQFQCSITHSNGMPPSTAAFHWASRYIRGFTEPQLPTNHFLLLWQTWIRITYYTTDGSGKLLSLSSHAPTAV